MKPSVIYEVIYLTFDDGPNEGTPNVLKALQVDNHFD